MIKGLRRLPEQIESWPEIKSIIPGEIRPIKSGGKLTLTFQYETPSGVKYLAKSNSAVQEVFIVTQSPKELIQRLENFSQRGRP